MGYPWAEGVAKAVDTSLSVQVELFEPAAMFPDYCPAVDNGIATECNKLSSRAAAGDIAVVSCRGEETSYETNLITT